MFVAELLDDIKEGGGVGPYREVLVVKPPDGPGDIERFVWACGNCGRVLDKPGPGCPDHAPTDVAGLVLAECWAVPPTRHNPVWGLAGECEPPPCPSCVLKPYLDRENARFDERVKELEAGGGR